MSASNIISLKTARVLPADYFVDANVWILSLFNFDDLQRWEQQYASFFYNIVESTLDPGPNILMPTLLLSEITNTYMKKVALPDYEQVTGQVVQNYKRDYKGTQHYNDNFAILMDNISGLSNAIRFVDDRLLIEQPQILTQRSIRDFDYNDHLYYHLCKKLNKTRRVLIVTCDRDFTIGDIELITSNPKLLGKRNVI
jgi:hypothetical protein